MSKNLFEIVDGINKLKKVVITHSSGSKVDVYLKGATVTSWKTANGAECLYLSDKSYFDLEHPIRGGIPIVFPQFGPGELPLHGFARLAEWSVLSKTTLADGSACLVLAVTESDYTKGMWNYKFTLEYTITLNETFSVQLAVKNTDDKEFDFATLFHTYFHVGDIANASVRGLAGVKATDRILNKDFAVSDAPITFDKETNTLFNDTIDTLQLDDPQNKRTFMISRSKNLTDTVVWNPWAEQSKKVEDFSDSSYKYFACVEAGAVVNKVCLRPGASAVFFQTISLK